MSAHPVAAQVAPAMPVSRGSIFDNVPSPDADWAASHSDRALAFLYVSPRPCPALDRLLSL